jgi:multiple sugar transport system substrate-binding protein
MRSTVSRRRWLGGAAALAGPALAACSSGATGPGPAGGAHAPVTITIWHHPLFPWRADVGKEITDPLLAANPWLTLESTELIGGGGNAGREKVLAATAAGSPPDSFTSGYTDTQDFMDGVVRNLEQYLRTSKVIQKSDIWEGLRRDFEFKGNLVSLPYAPDTRQLFVHSESAEKAGLDPNQPPAKWSELEAAAVKALRSDGGTVQHMGWAPFWGSGGVNTWMVPYWQLGGELLSADQTKVTIFNEKSIRVLTWLKKVVDDQGGWERMMAFRDSFPSTGGAALFMAGATTYYYATLSERSQNFKVTMPDLRFNVAIHPLPDEGGTPSTYGGCHSLPVSGGSKNPDVTWMVLEHVTNPENNIKFAVRFDRVPIRESSGSSPAYLQDDRGRKVQIDSMKRRRFVITAPGGNDINTILDVVTPYMSGQAALQDTLKETERKAQEILDRFAERVRNFKV